MTELPGTLELAETEMAAGREGVLLVVVPTGDCCGLVRLPSSWFKF